MDVFSAAGALFESFTFLFALVGFISIWVYCSKISAECKRQTKILRALLSCSSGFSLACRKVRITGWGSGTFKVTIDGIEWEAKDAPGLGVGQDAVVKEMSGSILILEPLKNPD